jgi:hypothetical protein
MTVENTKFRDHLLMPLGAHSDDAGHLLQPLFVQESMEMLGIISALR